MGVLLGGSTTQMFALKDLDPNIYIHRGGADSLAGRKD